MPSSCHVINPFSVYLESDSGCVWHLRGGLPESVFCAISWVYSRSLYLYFAHVRLGLM